MVLTGTGLITGLISVSVALIVVAVVIVITLKGDTSFKRLFNASEPVGLLLIVFGAAAAAGLAGLVQFSPAVAAFLVGLLLTGELAEVARRRLDPLRELFAAIFFVYFGLSTDISNLPAVLLPAAGLALLTIGTKFVTGWFAAATVEGGTISRLRAGALLSARGEFSVIIAGLVAVSGILPRLFKHSLRPTYSLPRSLHPSSRAGRSPSVGGGSSDPDAYARRCAPKHCSRRDDGDSFRALGSNSAHRFRARRSAGQHTRRW